jgi:hypothetical protein
MQSSWRRSNLVIQENLDYFIASTRKIGTPGP